MSLDAAAPVGLPCSSAWTGGLGISTSFPCLLASEGCTLYTIYIYLYLSFGGMRALIYYRILFWSVSSSGYSLVNLFAPVLARYGGYWVIYLLVCLWLTERVEKVATAIISLFHGLSFLFWPPVSLTGGWWVFLLLFSLCFAASATAYCLS